MAFGLVAHRVAQRCDHVFLAADLVESTGAVTPVQGLMCHGPSLVGSTVSLSPGDPGELTVEGAVRTVDHEERTHRQEAARRSAAHRRFR